MKIKPFKMLCENIDQVNEVVKILEKSGCCEFPGSEGVAIVLHPDKDYQLLDKCSFLDYEIDKNVNKSNDMIITYSKFIKLYSKLSIRICQECGIELRSKEKIICSGCKK